MLTITQPAKMVAYIYLQEKNKEYRRGILSLGILLLPCNNYYRVLITNMCLNLEYILSTNGDGHVRWRLLLATPEDAEDVHGAGLLWVRVRVHAAQNYNTLR